MNGVNLQRLAKAITLCLLALAPVNLYAVEFRQIDACFVADDNRVLDVTLEVAKTGRQRQRGLMERTELGASQGMLFIYPRVNNPERGFWMYNTLIPLDIAYLDADRRIAGIRSMPPCLSEASSQCPHYPAGVEYQYAVEMPQGYFSDQGVVTGDKLIWGESGTPRCQ